jgi:hypothetical protein
MGTLEPSWNLFDLLRPGRGEDWERADRLRLPPLNLPVRIW